MNEVVRRRRELEDAQVVLTRYRQMCVRLTVGFTLSVIGLITCGVFWWLGAGAEMTCLAVPSIAVGIATFASFIAIVCDAQGEHPADKVRVAQYAYDDARDEELEQWDVQHPVERPDETPMEELS